MSGQSFTPWASGGIDAPGTSNSVLGPSPLFRDAKDRMLAAWGTTPEAAYPDGYLGTQASTSRRSDKLLNAIDRTNQRQYSRGVHKGERINPGDYVWPKEFNPMTGLEFEARGLKWAPNGAIPVVLVNDGKAGPRGVPTGLERRQEEVIDMQRRSMLKQLAPGWR